MEPIRLLAIIEVPYSDRVRCAAVGCGHSVYRRVHIVRQDGTLKVLGSTCFAREFHGHQVKTSNPEFTGTAGRILTAEERELLAFNTERLIESFEAERSRDRDAFRDKGIQPEHSFNQPPLRSMSADAKSRPLKFSPAERASAEPEARRTLNAKYGSLDFDSPGFSGLLQFEIDRILRERIA